MELMRKGPGGHYLRRVCIGIIVCLVPLYLSPRDQASAFVKEAQEPPVSLGGGYSEGNYGGGSPDAVPVATTTVTALASQLDDLRPASGSPLLRVAVISSGIEVGVFPTGLQGKIAGPSAGSSSNAVHLSDAIGYGTYAASVVFQLSTQTAITSFSAYRDGALDPDAFIEALGLVQARASSLDAVLIAIPPSEYLDPITAAHAAGAYEFLLDMIAAAPIYGATGPVYGLAMDTPLSTNQGSSWLSRSTLDAYRAVFKRWKDVIAKIGQITSAGLTVSVPSGDLGPNPQSLFGVANLSEVITVGGFRPEEGMSPRSSAGPSIELKIKPDLLAPTGITGVLPWSSKMAIYLGSLELTDPSYPLEWEDSTGMGSHVRSLLDTTLTSAAVVTVRLAALRAADLAGEGAAGTGVDLSTKRQRGALYTSSTPLSGVPVWRQGQGALGGQDLSISMPGFALAAGNGIPLSHADLGLEPASGSWQVVVPIPGGASAATVTVSDFVGVTYTARFETSTTEPAPDVSAQADNDGITVSVPLPIPISKKEGLYCGYVETNVTVRIEDIPTCLIRGLTPIARSLGIHDRSADDQAFSLAPTLPPGSSLVEHPIHLLPINPVDTSLFSKITGARDCLLYHDIPKACHGHAPFSVVPPGFYTVRGWADYGAPTESELQVNTSGVWTTQTVTDELGGRLAYTKYKTLLLARAPECSETYGQWDDWSIQAPGEIANPDKWKDCTEDWLEDRTPPDADVTFTYHAATAGFIVSGADLPEPIRMNLGFLRKAADASVATQVIDIIRPCSDLSFTGFQSPELFRPSDLIPGLPGPGDVINIPDPLDVGWHPVCLQFVCANLPGPILIDPGIPNIPTDSVEDDPSIPWQGSCANAESLLAQYTDSEDSASEGYVTEDGPATTSTSPSPTTPPASISTSPTRSTGR